MIMNKREFNRFTNQDRQHQPEFRKKIQDHRSDSQILCSAR